VIEHFHGVKFEKPFTRMREYVEVINLLMRGDKLRYAGKVLQLERGFQLQLRPVRPHIPIWIASINPKSVRQTAEIADGWLPIFLPKTRWKAELAVLFDAIDAAGRKRDEVEVRCPYTITVTDQPERAAQSRRSLAVRYIARMGEFYYQLFVRMGYEAEANAVRAAYARGGTEAANAALSDALVNELGFAGSVDACRDALAEAEEAGFSVLSVSVAERDPQKRAAIFRKLVD
jgi:alkanesulfonate monooxygenase SsuD/methylene tetrahydromethanopterin reductase-like flavin-dependent oxidoreductase (luciferase family)